ncbi:DUF7837 family putative zinc-binding protein [Halorubrum vacuolatum]
MVTPNPEAALGTCPFCGETVADRHVLIHYEKASGDQGVWAECPGCQDVIDPVSQPE